MKVRCPHRNCKKEVTIFDDEVLFTKKGRQAVCPICGQKFFINWILSNNPDYMKDEKTGAIKRRIPKEKMSKKERIKRRMERANEKN
jgi:uncharacterized Zn finger protein (UPF0148 family)